MQSWRIPIQFMRQDGQPPANILDFAHPYIDLEFATGHEGPVWRRVKAMVDTGCSYTLLAPELIRGAGLRMKGHSELITNFSRQDRPMYSAAIRLVGAEIFTLACEVSELDVRPEDGECLAVLGWDYLRFCRCVIEGPDSESYLDLLERRIRLGQEVRRQAQAQG